MSPNDDVPDRMDRLARRQDQLERQQRDTTRSVGALRRDADSGIENLRWNTDLELKHLEWNTDLRVKDLEQKTASLERFQNFIESLILYAIMIGCAVALAIFIVLIVVEAREARPENGQPEGRSLILLRATRAAPGEQVQPTLPPWDTSLWPQWPKLAPSSTQVPVGWSRISGKWAAYPTCLLPFQKRRRSQPSPNR